MASNNSNYNKISVKTDSMVKMIEQLSKLGVFKEKRKKRAKRTAAPEDIRQDGDMGPGSVKSLEGEPGRGNPNLFALRQIEPGMTQQQIADITERNNAGVAALRAEVSQQRLADIEQQQGQRFADITKLGGIMNPVLERFRGAQDPGAGQRPDPFAQASQILLPDIQEETFTQTLNEGGPRAQPTVQTELFAEGEEEEARLGPQERLQIGGGGMSSAAAEMLGMPESFIAKTKKASKPTIQKGKPTQKQFLELSGIRPLPPKNTTLEKMRNYYNYFSDEFLFDPDESLYSSKEGMYKDMVEKIDDLINLSIE
jgi:hypothetical protein